MEKKAMTIEGLVRELELQAMENAFNGGKNDLRAIKEQINDWLDEQEVAGIE